MAARFLVSSRFQGQFVVRLREGLGVQMHPKSWHCQKGGGEGFCHFPGFFGGFVCEFVQFPSKLPDSPDSPMEVIIVRLHVFGHSVKNPVQSAA